MYNAIDISKYIVNYELDNGRTVNVLRLQKLLYFVQALFIVNQENNNPCFYQDIEAWDCGPVIPEVYAEYKFFGGNSIPEQNESKLYITQKDKDLIDSMLDACSKITTNGLGAIAQSQNPWKNAFYWQINRIISKESIKKYFIGK